MTSRVLPTEFGFDFTRADRVIWTHSRRDGGLPSAASPANFYINDREIADQFSAMLRPILADLVDVAVAVHMADRLALRDLYFSSGWSRQFKLSIAVRCLERWKDARVKSSLEQLLSFLTEDEWNLSFVAHQDGGRASEIQQHLFKQERDGDLLVSLFSGGLDSLAGTANAIQQNSRRSFVLVSVSPNPQQRFRQQQQVKLLRQNLNAPIWHICIPFALRRGDEYAQEPTRRTRGFLFVVLGVVTAISGGVRSLDIYENGWGALNLPYHESQIGTHNTRAVHPRFLRQASQFLQLLTEDEVSILNRSIYQTKAAMLRSAEKRVLASCIPLSFSCDGFPVRTSNRPQCGFCTSCLLRRYSLEAAELSEFDSDSYLQDWKQNRFKRSKHHLHGLRAMDWQARRLSRCLNNTESWHSLVTEFPELRTVVTDLAFLNHQSSDQVVRDLMCMLREHVANWNTFSALHLLHAA